MKGVDNIIFAVSTIALILSLIGNILVNYKKKIGFIIWIISNVFWVAINILGTPNYPQIVMYLIYMGLNAQGYMNWSKRGKS